jgi:hypothetical protein
MSRGKLTEKVKELLIQEDFEGTVVELRLLPYVMVKSLDNSSLDIEKLSGEEIYYLNQWAVKGWIKKPFDGLQISSEFYQKMVKILQEGYLKDVIYENCISRVLP